MRNHFVLFTLFILSLTPEMGKIVAQSKCLDSLKLEITKLIDDSNKVNSLNNLSWDLVNYGEYDASLAFSNQAIKLSEKIGYKKGLIYAYTNNGNVYMYKGNYPEAIKNNLSALKIADQTNNSIAQGTIYTNIGNVYANQGSNDEALKNYFKCLQIYTLLKSKKGIANAYNNIGLIYQNQGNYTEAAKNQLAALHIREEMNDKRGVAYSYNNMGIFYWTQGKYDDALKYFYSSLKLKEELGDKEGMASTYGNISETYKDLKKYKEAEMYGTKALNLSKEIRELDGIKEASLNLSNVYKGMGRDKEALEKYKEYIIYKDSLLNEENTKKTVQTQMQYEFDKKQTADSLKIAEERKINEVKFKQEKQQRYFLYFGLALVVLFAAFIFNRFRVTQKQKIIIEQKEQETQKQKRLVEEKQKEILDSITYAKRLQSAILPPQEFIDAHLPNNFILYKPKDIVAGDFYWAENINNLFFIAAADSTGHGVPGAMVSVVCSNALNRSVKEFGLRDTGKILDKTRELVIETFIKSNAEVKDGMDISLLCIDKQNKKVLWSGANNPLWFIQNNELKEIKADKQPVGKSYNEKPFTANEIEFQENTIFYLFTDGLADQFGGLDGKKFKYKSFENLLLSLSNKPMEEQKQLINQVFEKWKGELDQVDDVCVIGIKI